MPDLDDGKEGINRCQSPSEHRLAEAFASALSFEWRQMSDHHWEVGRWSGWFLALLGQPQYGRYRMKERGHFLTSHRAMNATWINKRSLDARSSNDPKAFPVATH